MKERDKENRMINAYMFLVFSYFIAFLISIFMGIIFYSLHSLLMILLADIAGTLVIFIISTIIKNTSLYDPYWSVAPLIIALFFLLFPQIVETSNMRYLVVFIIIAVWSIRLTFNWLRQWGGLKHEDWRYMYYRRKMGRKFWFINLTGLQLMPTILVYLGSISIYPIISLRKNSFNFLDILGIIITIGAILIETISDQQLHNFIENRESSQQFITNGLWKYSRHPNYFGEILFWWGLYIFALASDLSFFWAIIGPISITLLFLLVSIPLMEKRNLERKPEYIDYIQKVSRLLPWLPKKRFEKMN
ncbi:MAG: DUF1295 domain-containing protein [Promethearchaeota archaeon]